MYDARPKVAVDDIRVLVFGFRQSTAGISASQAGAANVWAGSSRSSELPSLENHNFSGGRQVSSWRFLMRMRRRGYALLRFSSLHPSKELRISSSALLPEWKEWWVWSRDKPATCAVARAQLISSQKQRRTTRL